jgi:hypothetical protein
LFLSCLKLKKLDKIDNLIEEYINKFIPFTSEMVLYTPLNQQHPIIWTGVKETDNVFNSMKSKALQFISLMIQYNGVQTIRNQVLLEHTTKLVNPMIASIKFVISDKMSILNELEREGEQYETLIFQTMLFFSRLFTRDPVITHFQTMVEE